MNIVVKPMRPQEENTQLEKKEVWKLSLKKAHYVKTK